MPHTFYILGVKISISNIQSACGAIENWIFERKKTYVCIAPVATIVDCQGDEKYRGIINNAGMATPDGMPLVWLGRMKGYREIERTYGPDLFDAFLKLSQQKQYRHYFYGGTPRTLNLLIDRLKERYPQLNISGCYSPPFRDMHDTEEQTVLDKINHSHPDILWIGLGSPKQDYWMYYHRHKLNVPVMVGIGAAFDFVAGTKPQAPQILRQSGLEWMFRLCSEPSRLWRRYLIGNTKFIFYLALDSAKNFFGRFKTRKSTTKIETTVSAQ